MKLAEAETAGDQTQARKFRAITDGPQGGRAAGRLETESEEDWRQGFEPPL